MKKKYSFALIEILISMTLIAVVLGFFSKGIFHSTKKSIQDINNIASYNDVKNFLVHFEMEKLPTLSFDELPPFQKAKWEKIEDYPLLQYRFGHYLSYEKILKDQTNYRLLCLHVKNMNDKNEYKQVFIIKKSSRKK